MKDGLKTQKKRKGAEGVPTPEQVVAARLQLGLTQAQAAALVRSPARTWMAWESPEGTKDQRYMHPGLWELFRIKSLILENETFAEAADKVGGGNVNELTLNYLTHILSSNE